MANVLAVVAHPDDESLLMGGTLAKHVESGDLVWVVALADGVGSRYAIRTPAYEAEAESRGRCFRAALALLGAGGSLQPIFEDQRSDTVPQWEINVCVGSALRDVPPDRVYTHYPHDLNLDHRRVAEAVLVETRGKCPVYCAEPEFVERALVPFRPDHYQFIDIEKKLAACACYPDELREFPHPRSIEAIRDRASDHGSRYALNADLHFEAFVVYA